MVIVWNRFMSAGWTVTVLLFVSRTFVFRCACAFVTSVFGQRMFIYMIAMNVVQMSIVQVIYVIVVLNCFMPA